MMLRETYLSRRSMQHPYILRRQYMHTRTRLHMPNFDEARLKSQYVRIRQGKRLRLAFPGNLPVLPGSPAVSIDEEGEVGIVEEKLAVEPLDVDGFGIFLSGDKVERCVGLVE